MDQSTIVVREDTISDTHVFVKFFLCGEIVAREQTTFVLFLCTLLVERMLHLVNHVSFKT